MFRIVLMALMVAASVWLALRIARELRQAEVDWQGVAFAVGFVALAFYLCHATEIGGLS